MTLWAGGHLQHMQERVKHVFYYYSKCCSKWKLIARVTSTNQKYAVNDTPWIPQACVYTESLPARFLWPSVRRVWWRLAAFRTAWGRRRRYLGPECCVRPVVRKSRSCTGPPKKRIYKKILRELRNALSKLCGNTRTKIIIHFHTIK